MAEPYPLVSVVIPNWNGKRFLRRCLDALLGQTYPALEVIVVDNGSQDGSVAFIQTAYPQVRVIALDHNMGFARATNMGFAEARGEYVMTLNNDTELAPACIAELVRVIERHPAAWSCSPKIIGFEHPPVIVNAGIESRDFEPRDRGRGEPDDGRYDRIEEVFGPNGGAGLYRRAVVEEIGGFDEDFFMYYEDVDLAWRARFAGWISVYAPRAVCRHELGGTSKTRPFFTEYHIFRNRIWLFVKDLPAPYLREKLSTLLKQELIFWMDHLRRRDVKWLRMKVDTYRKLPKMLRKRRRIQRSRKISDQEFERWYRPETGSVTASDTRTSPSLSSTGTAERTP